MGRKNPETILQAAAVDLTAAASTSGNKHMLGSHALRVDINISSISGAGAHNATFTLQGYDDAADAYFTLLASAAKTAAGRFSLQVGPGAPATANVSANELVPALFRLNVTGTATAISFTAQVTYVGF